jgi:hypothetical protein
MPARNARRFVSTAVTSLNAQTHREWELVLVDDGSDDDTVEIVHRLAEKPVVLVSHKTSQGVAKSLNDGIEAARGDYIMRFDADDVCHPMRMENSLAEFAETPVLDVLATSFQYISATGRFLPSGNAVRTLDTPDVALSLLLQNPICHPSVMMRRSSLGDIRYAENYQWEDYELWLRTRSLWHWKILQHPSVYWRLHDSNQSRKNAHQAVRQLAAPLASAWMELGVDADQDLTAELLLPGSTGRRDAAIAAWQLTGLWESLMRMSDHRGDDWARRTVAHWRLKALVASRGALLAELAKEVVFRNGASPFVRVVCETAVRRAARG